MFKWLFLLLCGVAVAEEPSAVYLTWIHDPCTTMTVQWHTSRDATDTHLIYFDTEGNECLGEGTVIPLPGTDRLVHTVELTNLDPDTCYTFQFEKEGTSYSFATLPKTLSRPLQFIVGGDAYYHLYLFNKINQQMVRHDPLFIVVGGDIAYACRHPSLFGKRGCDVKRWLTFLKEWTKEMTTSDGRLIPLIPVIGNHDIKIPKTPKEKKEFKDASSLFYDLFAMPKKGVSYRALDVSNYLSLILLDTGHHHSISGKQAEWLSYALAARSATPYRFALYHIGAYPSVYRFNSSTPYKIRRTWVPLFEQYRLSAAFEHHNHAYKITHPLIQDQPAEGGIRYLGDGAWGVSPRRPLPLKNAPYLEKVLQINHFWLITLTPSLATIQSYDIKGQPLDTLEISPLEMLHNH